MIGPKEAVRAAAQFLMDIQAGGQPSDIIVEEIEGPDQFGLWEVTLSFRRLGSGSELQEALGGAPERQYKRFRVDGESGKVVSMKFAAVS